MKRPSESLSAAVGSIVGAVFILIGATTSAEISSEVQGAVIVLVSWIAAGVTWYVARRQRSGELVSAADGTVTEAASTARPSPA
jgi:hypothetical protein